MANQDDVYNHIIDKSLTLFNTKGIHQTSIQDIMSETGLPKGSIYRRFQDKNKIVLAAYEKAGRIIWSHIIDSIESKDSTTEKIIAIAEIYLDAVHNPPIEGGCPLLNTAVESDSSFPELKAMTSEAFQNMIEFVASLLKEGIEAGEFTSELNPHTTASYLLSSMEGAIMASRLSLSNEHIQNNIAFTKKLLVCYTR
ncbi:TetR family transcriptional regulator [Paenibacillus sp. BIHB 4019]|uniref:TetR family transcriptional regulator n=1 Tax=Paenibacillus sp. BIHB 4019 TaxID=1870819 RepID=A0A1B2DEC4_9BACL|nr:TetR/AcrR family transcriptional regulator [Paenibacillus sp. BIHB 4019]ANY66053.1 TetR family transcriptional regulator [Paenibacillus sp. BIHB 4019]